MKRYIREFCKRQEKSLDGVKDEYKKLIVERIEKALFLNEQHYITDFEAINMILNAVEYVTSTQ